MEYLQGNDNILFDRRWSLVWSVVGCFRDNCPSNVSGSEPGNNNQYLY